MQTFCKALPKDRLLDGDDHDMDAIIGKDKGKRAYTIPSTGARLTYRHAVDILERYAKSLVSEEKIGVLYLDQG